MKRNRNYSEPAGHRRACYAVARCFAAPVCGLRPFRPMSNSENSLPNASIRSLFLLFDIGSEQLQILYVLLPFESFVRFCVRNMNRIFCVLILCFLCIVIPIGCAAKSEKKTVSSSLADEEAFSEETLANITFAEPSYIKDNESTVRNMIKETGSLTMDGEALLKEYGFRPDMMETERRRWHYSLSDAYQKMMSEREPESGSGQINPDHLRSCENEFVDFSNGLIYRIEEINRVKMLPDYPSESFGAASLDFLEPGGAVKETYLRGYQNEDGIFQEESVPQAVIEVRMTVKNTTDFDAETVFTPRLLILKEEEEGLIIWWPPYKYRDIDSKTDEVFRFYKDAFPFYLNTAFHNEKGVETEFYHFRVPSNQEQELKVCYLIDLDYEDGLYLCFDFSGMDYRYDSLDISYIPLKWKVESK